LDGLINECRDVKDMRCIVFVERKIATKVLAYFLSSIAMFASSLQFQSLAGKTEGMDAMTRKSQQEAVQSFRAGHVRFQKQKRHQEINSSILSFSWVVV
jgi:ERCC4-related helicase